ncbi:EpsG family protein [Sodalis sp. RH15]|uniref:EpsG family protein n=1 Tax=Sodalis sp. RH15 TaxID=3394330 RepID=UPI0039B455E2
MQTIFYLSFTTISIISIIFIILKNAKSESYYNDILIFPVIYCFFFTIILAYNKEIFSDSLDYANYFSKLVNWSFVQAYNDPYSIGYMPGFKILSWILAHTVSNVHFYFSFISGLIFIMVAVGCVRTLGLAYGSIAIISYTMYPYFSSYTALGIRQGLALGAMLIFFSYIIEKKKTHSLIWLFIAVMFHNTAIVLLALYIPIFLHINQNKLSKIVGLAWLFTLILSFANVFEKLIAGYVNVYTLDVRYQLYFNQSADYVVGFRPDFVLFSLFPYLLYRLSNKKMRGDDQVKTLLVSFYTLNCLMNIFSFMPYYDRFAAYSWFLIPIFIALLAKKGNSRNIFNTLLMILLPASNILLFIIYNSKWYFGTP